MKFTEYLIEAANEYAIVVTTHKSNNAFEDADLYNAQNEEIVTLQSGHAQNMFKGLMKSFSENDDWDSLGPFLKKHSRNIRQLGDEYGETEHFNFIAYGNFSADDLGHLISKYEGTY